MKRRQFLAAAVGLAGGVAGRSAWTGTAPCPPDAFSVTRGTSVNASCDLGNGNVVPAWFDQLPAMQWVALAGGPEMAGRWQKGNRLAEAVPPPPYFGNYGPRFLTAGWNGACVDPSGMEMIVALNGGHSARQENDAYALSLASDVPGWRRIVDSTPLRDSSSGKELLTRGPLVDPDNQPYQAPLLVPGWAQDGPQPEIAFDDRAPDLRLIRRRPRTLHTCSHYHYSNGKVWYPIMNSWDRGVGDTSLVKLALDVDSLRRDPGAGNWRYGDPGPWQYLGTIAEQTSGRTDAYGFGVAALDRATGKIWYCGQKTSTYWSMDTLGAKAGSHQFYDDAPRAKDFSSSAGAIAHEVPISSALRTSLFVVMEQGTYRLWVLDTRLVGTGKAWSAVEPVNASSMQWAVNLQKIVPGYTGYPAAYGMVYHAPGRCFLAYNCDQLPDRAVVRVLRIPLRADGTYDPRGEWRWSEARLGAVGPDDNNPNTPGIGGGGGSYTRFNCLTDFAGTPDSLLIHLSRYDRPTWICRLPPDAFN